MGDAPPNITFTGVYGEMRRRGKEILRSLGATYSGTLEAFTTSALVCDPTALAALLAPTAPSHKLRMARDAGIPVLSYAWLQQSAAAGHLLPPQNFELEVAAPPGTRASSFEQVQLERLRQAPQPIHLDRNPLFVDDCFSGEATSPDRKKPSSGADIWPQLQMENAPEALPSPVEPGRCSGQKENLRANKMKALEMAGGGDGSSGGGALDDLLPVVPGCLHFNNKVALEAALGLPSVGYALASRRGVSTASTELHLRTFAAEFPEERNGAVLTAIPENVFCKNSVAEPLPDASFAAAASSLTTALLSRRVSTRRTSQIPSERRRKDTPAPHIFLPLAELRPGPPAPVPPSSLTLGGLAEYHTQKHSAVTFYASAQAIVGRHRRQEVTFVAGDLSHGAKMSYDVDAVTGEGTFAHVLIKSIYAFEGDSELWMEHHYLLTQSDVAERQPWDAALEADPVGDDEVLVSVGTYHSPMNLILGDFGVVLEWREQSGGIEGGPHSDGRRGGGRGRGREGGRGRGRGAAAAPGLAYFPVFACRRGFDTAKHKVVGLGKALKHLI